MAVSSPTALALDLTPGASARTPFERNLLPGFARWFLDEVSADPPDLFIPVETKGARLLDATLAYIRDELGSPLRIPVLYRPALAYLEPSLAERKSVLILDDATRTGNTLAKHRKAVEVWGLPTVRTLACIADAGPNGNAGNALDAGVRCWLPLPTDDYYEHLWQLAELVVARGLPPEVDHHVFRLRLRSRLSRAWSDIAEALSPYGELTLDGALTTYGDTVSMTLHWPHLPGQPKYPTEGAIRDEGVRKARLFADFAEDSIFIVPMAFPVMDVAAEKADSQLALGDCQKVISAWSGARSTVADLLVASAHARTPEMLYRAASTAAEADVVVGVARAIGAALGNDVISFSSEREAMDRLYGPAVGSQVTAILDREIAAGLAEGATTQVPPSGIPKLAASETDPYVLDVSRRIVHLLRDEFHAECERLGVAGGVRVGRALPDLRSAFPDLDDLLVSRAIDYGLAVTSLVPYTHAHLIAEGQVRVERFWRASEPAKRSLGGNVEDLASHKRQNDEEAIALVARFLRRRSRRWKDSSVALLNINKIVAILQRLAFEKAQLSLGSQPGPFGPEAVLGSPMKPETLRGTISEHFVFVRDGIVQSDAFDERYAARTLRLQKREAASSIEGYLLTLVPALDDAPNVADLLTAWGSSANGKLGLDYVSHDLEVALRALENPLKVLARGDALDEGRLRKSTAEAREFVGIARDKVELLTSDWSASVRDRWSDPVSVELDLLTSLAVPLNRETLFGVVNALCAAIDELRELVRRTEVWCLQGTLLSDSDEEVVSEIVARCAGLEYRLLSFGDPSSLPHIPDDHDGRQRLVAERINEVLLAMRSFAAAFSWDYLGSLEADVYPDESRKRTILCADLAGSTAHGLTHPHASDVKWRNGALNLVAQWGQAFGGIEIKGRAGDDIVLEFAHADSALLCAAIVQEHASALRSTGLAALNWAFRIGLDTDEISDADGGNVIGTCIDRAAKLAKTVKDEGSIERVVLTPETKRVLSAVAHQWLSEMDNEVDLAPGDETLTGAAAAHARFRPLQANRLQLLEHYSRRLSGR